MLLFQLVDLSIYWKQSLKEVPGSQLKSENIETLTLSLECIARTSADRL